MTRVSEKISLAPKGYKDAWTIAQVWRISVETTTN